MRCTMSKTGVAIGAFGAIWMSGCSREPDAYVVNEAPASGFVFTAYPEAEAATIAVRGSDLLLGTMMGELAEALAAGTPEDAIGVCHSSAQAVADQVGARQGVKMRRTSLRVRNERNAPDAFERTAMERWLTQPNPEAVTEVVTRDDGTRELRYLRPIVLPGLCVACHGAEEKLSHGVRMSLRRYYPHDRAVGYAEGDVRGAVSVRVRLTGEPRPGPS